MQISSNIRNEILYAYRSGASIHAIASSFGYNEKQVETVIFPNGKEPKTLPVVIHRKKSEKSVEKDVDIVALQATIQSPDSQKEKWSNAGKKAWITRQQNKLREQQKMLPPAASDQPIALQVSHLITMHQEDKEQALKLIAEAMEYIKIGLEGIQTALQLLNK